MTENGNLRHLPLVGTYNIRDLGGYPTSDGRTTRWRAFLRGDALHRLPPVSQQTLLDMGLDTVIDLRFANELAEAPNVFATSVNGDGNGNDADGARSVKYVNISLMDGLARAASAQPLDNLEAVYQAVLTHCQPALCAVFAVISASKDAPVLFHCTAGKDRTGLIAALLLGLAEVAPEIIAEDYALTDQYLGTLKQELRDKAAASGQDLELYERMLEAKAEAMLKTLTFIHEKYNTVAAYLLEIGLGEEQVMRLRSRIVE